MQETCYRPPKHNAQEAGLCSQAVEEPSASGVHSSISQKECALQMRERRVRNGDVFADLRNCNRKRLPVEITEQNSGAQQGCDSPPEPLWFWLRHGGWDYIAGFGLRMEWMANELMRSSKRERDCFSWASISNPFASSRCSSIRRRLSAASLRPMAS